MSADVKWIKISTDIFNDEKIQIIETMPEGKTLICLWFKLLCLAGRTNMSGWICLAEKPYTEAMLAAIFRENENVIRIALDVFEKFGMIEYSENGVMGISNWQKNQATEGLEAIRAKGRERMARWRENQKKLLIEKATEDKTECSDEKKATAMCELPTDNGTAGFENIVTDNLFDVNSIMNNNEIRKKQKVKEDVIYHEFRDLEYPNIKISEKKYQTLVEKYGKSETDDMVVNLSLWKQSNGKKTKDDGATVDRWFRKRLEDRKITSLRQSFKQQEQNDFINYVQNNILQGETNDLWGGK